MMVDAGRGKLYDGQKTLRARWTELEDVWRDAIAKEFDERVWQPLDRQTSDLLLEPRHPQKLRQHQPRIVEAQGLVEIGRNQIVMVVVAMVNPVVFVNTYCHNIKPRMSITASSILLKRGSRP